ncbi:MAG: serine/threonine protein kinase [Acidobacteria bacterium]|nr:MAG: serine/threonine protein kinase [Acidobacteriota bacterium]
MSDGSPEAPRRIGPYRLEKRLGEGGMGEVHRAWDERLARWVAIKHIRPEAAASARVRARFRREARAAAAINHPAIVQIYDVVLDDARGDWIVMELVEGTTLSRLIAKAPLPSSRLMPLMREIADGLAQAHDKGIVHRDLKPENVMVTPEGHAKILDFGVAKRFGSDVSEVTISIEGSLLGTARAMSPEQALGHQLDGRSDLFSLGSLAYEALSGRSPFVAATPVDTLTRICTFEQPPLHEVVPGIEMELSLLIERLLMKEPSRRPQHAREVVTVLDEMIGTASGIMPLPLQLDSQTAPARPATEERKSAPGDDSTPYEGAGQPRLTTTSGDPLDHATTISTTPQPPATGELEAAASPAGRRRWLPVASAAVAILLLLVVLVVLGIL